MSFQTCITLFLLLNTLKDILKNDGNQIVLVTIYFYFMGIFQIIFFYVSQKNSSHKFGTTRGWENDGRIFIFGWTIPNIFLVWEYKSIPLLVPQLKTNKT